MVARASDVKLAAVGDISPGDHYFSLGHGLMSRTLSGQLSNLLTDVETVLQSADIAIGNLEGAISVESGQRSPVQAMAFRGLPPFCDVLRRAGFTHANVANNHIMQHGDRAFEDTIRLLGESDIKPVGLSGSRVGCISEPVVEAVGDRTVCLVGYSAVPERYARAGPRYALLEDVAAVVAEISWLRRQFDEVVVSCHAGDEGLSIPSPAITDLYRQFVTAGARCVLGHHSHVFQPVERFEDGIIAYSLGNFISDFFWDQTSLDSAVVVVTLGKTELSFDLEPTRFTRDYRVLRTSGPIAAAFLARVSMLMEEGVLQDEENYADVLASEERHGQREKYRFFLRNLHRGRTGKKLRFLVDKLFRL